MKQQQELLLCENYLLLLRAKLWVLLSYSRATCRKLTVLTLMQQGKTGTIYIKTYIGHYTDTVFHCNAI
jgi:hypothetical protein